MRKSTAHQLQTPGTIEISPRTAKNLRETMHRQREEITDLKHLLDSRLDEIEDLKIKILDQRAVINYLENKLDRTNPVRGN